MQDSVLALTISQNTLRVLCFNPEQVKSKELYHKQLNKHDFESFLCATILEASVCTEKSGVSFDLAFYYNFSCEIVCKHVWPLPQRLIYAIAANYREDSDRLYRQALDKHLRTATSAGLISSITKPKARFFELLFDFGYISLIETVFKTEDELKIAREGLSSKVNEFKDSIDDDYLAEPNYRDFEQKALKFAALSYISEDKGTNYTGLAMHFRVLEWLETKRLLERFEDIMWNWASNIDAMNLAQGKYSSRMEKWGLEIAPTTLLICRIANEINDRVTLKQLKAISLTSFESKYLQVVLYLLHDIEASKQQNPHVDSNFPLEFKSCFNISDADYFCALGFWQLDRLYTSEKLAQDALSKAALL